MMRTLVKLGSRVPLHASGVGKAIFASLPDEQIDAILKVIGLPRITENTIVVPETMWAALRVIRQRGYSFDDEEHARATRCVGGDGLRRARRAARRDLARRAFVAPCRTSASVNWGPIVAHIAEELTRKLGGRWPHPY